MQQIARRGNFLTISGVPTTHKQKTDNAIERNRQGIGTDYDSKEKEKLSAETIGSDIQSPSQTLLSRLQCRLTHLNRAGSGKQAEWYVGMEGVHQYTVHEQQFCNSCQNVAISIDQVKSLVGIYLMDMLADV